jgi:hypothetical protein
MGNISVTYSMSGLGIEGVDYTTSSLLKVTFLKPVNSGEARFNVTQEENEPELGLSKANFFFYNYSYSKSAWTLVNPVSNPVTFPNGTYVLQIPSGVDQSLYSIEVTDPRAISVTAFYSGSSLASKIPQYSYSFTWNQTLYSSLTRDTFDVEALQNGTLRWLGQNLQLSTNGKPILPLPVKDLHLNETIGGISRQVPFQVEDWGSNYRVPLGLTSNASIFGNRQMIVFLVNHNVQRVTFWWNGTDTAKQTSYAWTNRYFRDNPNNNVLSNGILNLTLTVSNSQFIITASSGGSTSSSAQFFRINGYNPTYGSPPAYVIYNGTVRDIVQQEAEWTNGILKSSSASVTANCPNVYSQICLTLPANATYYTYSGRLIFLNSSESRTITDLSVIQLSVSGTSLSQLTENGTSGGYPISSNVAGQFYNFTNLSFQTGWAHHWSEFISGSSGAGIMFTDDANRKLYTFDNVAGHKTGALNVTSPSKTIEFDPLDPRSHYNASFTYPLDVTWQGAVVTFNKNPINMIYNASTKIGLWVMVENPPKISISPNYVFITVTSGLSGGYVKVDGNSITTPTTFNWTIGSTHTLQAPSPVAGPAGTQYVCTGWSDGGAQNHTYTVPTSNATVTANYITQYRVSFVVSPSGSGTTSPSGTNVWENATSLSISASANSGYYFLSWSATTGITITSPTSASTTATLNANGTITVTFTKLNQFIFGTISSPQTSGKAFSITITAKDASGNTINGYNSSVGLSVSSGLTISPTSTGTSGWSSGVWTGSVTLTGTGTGINITANDGNGHTGTSNSFTVNKAHPTIDKSAIGTGTGSITINFPATASSGELIYISIAEGSGQSVSSITPSGYNFQHRTTVTVDSNVIMETWWGVSTTSSAQTITITFSSNSHSTSAVAFSVQGANTTSPFDGSPKTATGSGTSASVSNSTKLVANDLVIGVLGLDGSNTVSATGSNTLITSATSSGGRQTADEYQYVTTQTVTASYSWTGGSINWGIIEDAIKSA